jgi:hypothetical protein
LPYTIDEAAARKQIIWDSSKPQEQAPAVLPDNWVGTVSRGLPVREIPFFPFPRVVYLHPNEPIRTVVHRNSRHEVVHEEEIPLEHLTRVIGCEAHIKNGGPKDCPDCNRLLESVIGDGWLKEPYIPEPPPREDSLYGPRNTQPENLKK